eukprot:TRINITY_DN111454_c0_g1_i1.p1 TRINITY_DN111454_c0_g1~~TRINITY_DN111454_c0_g1_i1.p1  ORF type:complete len:205 (-),score=41.65 TRINITY_DN111454_c0_g1_i1:22-636(-)
MAQQVAKGEVAAEGESAPSVPESSGKAQKTAERHFEPGRWDNPNFFLPTLKRAKDNEDVMEDFRQKVVNRDLEGVKLLLHAGFPASIALSPRRCRTALHLAAEANDITMCQVLLRFRADPTMPAKPIKEHTAFHLQGKTPFDQAQVLENQAIVHLFSKHMHTSRELDTGPAPPARHEFPVRLELKANENNLMGSRDPRRTGKVW